MRGRAIAFVAASAAAAFLAACGAPAPEARDSSPPQVWPPAPATARIAFVRTVARPEDLGISRSLLQRLGDLLFGEADVRMVRPMAVVDNGAALFVADPGARGIHRYDKSAGDYRLIRGEKGAPLPSPVGLAAGAKGEVYVTDSALAAVFVIERDAEHARRLPIDDLRQPTGIAFDPVSSRLFVTDTARHQVAVFDSSGRRVSTMGERGAGPGEFNYPTFLWRDASGRLYVTDTLNFRVQVFDADGRIQRVFGRHGDGSGDAARQKGVATDRHGHIYVVDALFHAFQIFDAQGRLLLGVGAAGQDPGEFWLPSGIFVGADDTIYVADTYNRRVQVFRYVGAES